MVRAGLGQLRWFLCGQSTWCEVPELVENAALFCCARFAAELAQASELAFECLELCHACNYMPDMLIQ